MPSRSTRPDQNWRLDRADRHPLPVGRLVGVVVGGATVEHVDARAPRSIGPGPLISKNMVASRALPSTMAPSTTWPTPELRASSRAQTMPKASSRPPPPKSPTRLRGGTGAPPSGPIMPSTPGQRDVVDVVAGHHAATGPAGPIRWPARRPAAGSPAWQRTGPEPEPLGHAGPEGLDQPIGPAHQIEQQRAARPPSSGRWRWSVDPVRGSPRPSGVVGRSTRTTSAPMSASIMAQKGPAPSPATSTMRTPVRGPPGPVRWTCRAHGRLPPVGAERGLR